MYREEFTRRWHEDQFPQPTGIRNHAYHGGDEPYRKSQFNGRSTANNNYLSNGIPLPVRTESGLHGPAVRRHPTSLDNSDTNFGGLENIRKSYAASDNFGIENRGYSGYNPGAWNRRPYDSSSVAGVNRADRAYMYRGKAPSELGDRLPRFEPLPTESHSRDAVNSVIEHGNVPSWVKSLGPDEEYAEPDKSRRGSDANNGSKSDLVKNEMSTSYFIAIRIIIICLAVWDLVNDWLLTSTGPLSLFGGDNDHRECTSNNYTLNNTFKVWNYTDIPGTRMCSNTNNIWTLTAVFSLLGSLLTILQVINMVMEIVKKRRPYFFQILQGHSELCFIMVFEELPQCILFSVFLVYCNCGSDTNFTQKPIYLYSLMASISACFSATLRFVSSFDTVAGENGCCNTWWRFCCCRNTKYFCRLNPKECCCTCDMPCPLCCCTLGCKMCKYTPKTWCTSLLKAFSCFCGCCASEKDYYGLKIMNLFSIFILWVCLAFQIVIFYSMPTSFLK